jgi:hypothetical protein
MCNCKSRKTTEWMGLQSKTAAYQRSTVSATPRLNTMQQRPKPYTTTSALHIMHCYARAVWCCRLGGHTLQGPAQRPRFGSVSNLGTRAAEAWTLVLMLCCSAKKHNRQQV